MALTHTLSGPLPGGAKLVRSYDSGDNAQVTVSTPTSRTRSRRLIAVLVHYSGSVSKNITVTLDSALGSAFDNLLTTIALSSAADGTYYPATPLPLAPDDEIDVVVPASGTGGVTGSATILTEEL